VRFIIGLLTSSARFPGFDGLVLPLCRRLGLAYLLSFPAVRCSNIMRTSSAIASWSRC
jgi:hypothetical protein